MSSWRRVMAVGCTHGNLVSPQARADALAFKARFKPEIRFDLGDMIDTACFRAGAPGTKDEAVSPRDDHRAALEWLEEYEPTHLAFGNHDWRLHELMSHPKAIVATLAGDLWREINETLAILHCETRPYDIERGWFYMGGHAWGHGMMYNLFAVRDHAEMIGLPVVIAHLHAPQQVEGRTIRDTSSFCVGGLVDDNNLGYGRRRRNSLIHGHGVVYGEISDTEARLWLARSANGQPIQFPPGV